jgi:hypothetical protein
MIADAAAGFVLGAIVGVGGSYFFARAVVSHTVACSKCWAEARTKFLAARDSICEDVRDEVARRSHRS